jgi:hypothetical protein
MSWSKSVKGSFGEVREALTTVAAEVHDTDVKSKTSDIVRAAHHLQARVAVKAAEELTAGAPFQAASEDEEDRDLSLTLSGHGEADGSGNVSVTYKIGKQKPKDKNLSKGAQ